MQFRLILLLAVILMLLAGCGDGAETPYTAISFSGIPSSEVSFGANGTALVENVKIIVTVDSRPGGSHSVKFSIEDIDDSANLNISSNSRGKANMTIKHGNTNFNIGSSFSSNFRADSDGTVALSFIESLGQRKIMLKAEVIAGGKTYIDTAAISFGKGPIAAFAGIPQIDSVQTWDNANTVCASSSLPSYSQFETIVKSGAFDAAGWQEGRYWYDTNGNYAEIGDVTSGYHIVCKK